MKDKINAGILGFFFGAGASIEFGIPTMKSMTNEFYNLINRNNTEQKILFNDIYQSMEKIYGKEKVDIESIMSIILNLKDQYNFLENIGDFGRFILNKEKLDVKEFNYRYDDNVLYTLEKEYKEFIREKVILKTLGIDHSRKVYEDFFRQICSIATCNNASQKPPNLNDPYENTLGKWVFFTTNYDNSLEDYWKKYRKYNDLDLGFSGKNTVYPIMEANEFVNRNLSNRHNAMQLVKLHGSVNWIINEQGELEEHDYNQNYTSISSRSATKEVKEDLLVYPLSQKELYFTPFIQFFTILDSELKQRKIWIIIGYSFRDIIIRKMFEKALEANRSKILLIHPRATEVKNLFKDKFHKQILCLEKYFANKDSYEKINKEIAQTISNLYLD
jgi:SIR2-like protein